MEFYMAKKKIEDVTEQLTSQIVMDYTMEIATAYLSNNEVDQNELPELLKSIFQSVALVLKDSNSVCTRPAQKPAVPVEESVHDNYIICLEDGKKLQMLKRHLMTAYGLTVEQYKERWGLSASYPVVAPSYSRRRTEIAKTNGLGNARKKKKAA